MARPTIFPGLGPILGVVLAGGLSRRFGGEEKALVALDGVSLLERVIARARPQVDHLILNANGDPGRFAFTGLAVVADAFPGHRGPLAGLLAGLDHAAAAVPGCRWVATFPVDSPFLPRDLVARLAGVVGVGGRPAIAVAGRRRHPVFGLWPLALRDELRGLLGGGGPAAVGDFAAACGARAARFEGAAPDPFLNVNRPRDVARARALLRGSDGALSPRPRASRARGRSRRC
jgi:molybdopterin-guanine dinucleotide biosynthesis protein A